MVDDDPAEEDDDLEVDLEAVDVVSFALAVVSLGFNALASDSILAATVPEMRGLMKLFNLLFQFLVQRGHMPCPKRTIAAKIEQPDAW